MQYLVPPLFHHYKITIFQVLRADYIIDGKKIFYFTDRRMVFFFRLYCYAQKHVKSIRAVTKLPDTSMAKSFRSKSSRCKPPKPQTKTKPTSPYHVSDHKAAITVGVIMGVFLVCWVPFFCVNIVAAFCKTCISLRAFQVYD